MSDVDEKLHAARHEAGHAVIGFYNGRQPTSIFIVEQDNRWVGDCRFPPGKTKPEITAMTAIAGVLSQAKSNALAEVGDSVRFDTQSAKHLIQFLRDAQRSNEEPGESAIRFLTEAK